MSSPIDFMRGHFQGMGLTIRDWQNDTERADEVFTTLANTLNSNEDFEIDDTFHMEIVTIPPKPTGRGSRHKLKPGHQKSSVFRKTKQSVIEIKNHDDLCAARAIVVAKAKADNHPQYNSIKQSRGCLQTTMAYSLHQAAGSPATPIGWEGLLQYQAVLPEYRLLVCYEDYSYKVEALSEYTGENQPQLALLYSQTEKKNANDESILERHYDIITSLKDLHAKSYYCHQCLKAYNSQELHKCLDEDKICHCCLQANCAGYLRCKPQRVEPKIACHRCFEHFYDQACYDNHLNMTSSRHQVREKAHPVCLTHRRCKKCFKKCEGFQDVQHHKCGYGFCDSCENYVELAQHTCFIQPPKKKRKRGDNRPKKRQRLDSDTEDFLHGEAEADDASEEKKPPLNVYFDIESHQLNGEHRANLVVWSSDEHLEGCFRHAWGEDCLEKFIDDLQECTEGDTREVRAIAHNLQGYEGYFVLKHYYNHNYKVEQIRNGAKLMCVEMDNVKFIDSLNFFQMPLSKFPETFNLKEKAKGFFPHLFNRPENMNYVGPAPAQHFYMPESMTLKTKAAFDEFYRNAQAPVTVFNFKKELLMYCESDVDLLKVVLTSLGPKTNLSLFLVQ